MRAAVALAVGLGLAGAAHADDAAEPVSHPDPRAVDQAREANLEPESVREGFAFGIAIGPSVQLGFGVGDATGGGGGFNLRFGTVASPRWVWLLELAATAYPHDDTANQSSVLTFGGQLYVREAFWLRGGVGFASFTRRGDGTDAFRGLGGLGAGGFDLVRRGGLALSVEAATTAALYRDGMVLGLSTQLGLSWY